MTTISMSMIDNGNDTRRNCNAETSSYHVSWFEIIIWPRLSQEDFSVRVWVHRSEITCVNQIKRESWVSRSNKEKWQWSSDKWKVHTTIWHDHLCWIVPEMDNFCDSGDLKWEMLEWMIDSWRRFREDSIVFERWIEGSSERLSKWKQEIFGHLCADF